MSVTALFASILDGANGFEAVESSDGEGGTFTHLACRQGEDIIAAMYQDPRFCPLMKNAVREAWGALGLPAYDDGIAAEFASALGRALAGG